MNKEVKADPGKQTTERRETSLREGEKGEGNLSVGQFMRQSRLTIKK